MFGSLEDKLTMPTSRTPKHVTLPCTHCHPFVFNQKQCWCIFEMDEVD